MPLFLVEFTTQAVIEAESIEDAEDYGMREYSNIYQDCDIDVTALQEIKSVNNLPHGWNGKCYPFGYGKMRMIKTILDT